MPLTQWNVDPRFDRLDTHGGQTLTLALLPDSPAIDAGDSNFCPPTDQRGASRPSLHGCDVGAFEFVPTGFRIASIQLVDLGTVRIEGTGVPDEDFELEESGDLMLWHVAGTGRVDRYGLFTLQAPRAPELSFYRVAAP